MVASVAGVSRVRVYQLARALGLSRPAPTIGDRQPRPSLTRAAIAERHRQESSRQGRVAELAVASDLMARGYQVYWPLAGGGPDLIVTRRGETMTRVEVKSGKRAINGGVVWQRPATEADLYAVVCGIGDIVYRQAPDTDGKVT